MPDARFYRTCEPLSLSEAVKLAGARLIRGAGEVLVNRVDSLSAENLDDAVVYAVSAREASRLAGRTFGFCLTTNELADGIDGIGAVAAADDPRLGFARLAARLHESRQFSDKPGVHPQADIGVNVSVGPGVQIGKGAKIGAGCNIGSNAVIGSGVILGEDSTIGPGVCLSHAIIGVRFEALAGVKLGGPGFGFAPSANGAVAIPQLGRVIIGDDVHIGANSTVDRGALEDTVIEDGVKIDNLVQIAHNVRIGRHCILAAQVGIAGSTKLGRGVLIGGQGGLADHLEIGDGAQIGAKAGVMSDIPPGETWAGYPARPIRQWLRETANLKKLTKKAARKSHDKD